MGETSERHKGFLQQERKEKSDTNEATELGVKMGEEVVKGGGGRRRQRGGGKSGEE